MLAHVAAGCQPLRVASIPGRQHSLALALAGAVPAGLFPRDLSFDPATGQVLPANFNSGTIEQLAEPKAG